MKKNFSKSEPVDVHNAELMIALGIQPRNKESRDPSVWTKTASEKKALKEAKLRYKHEQH